MAQLSHLLLVCALCACGDTSTVNGSLLRPEYSQALDVAIEEWNTQMGCARFVRDDTSDRADLVVKEVASKGRWAALYWRGWIYIAPDTVGPHSVRALEHEMGHHLGLKHRPDDPEHLMHPGNLTQAGGPETTGLSCN